MNEDAKKSITFRKLLSYLILNFSDRYRSEHEAEKSIDLFFGWMKEKSGDEWQEKIEDNIILYLGSGDVKELDEAFTGLISAIKRSPEWFSVEELDNGLVKITLKKRDEWGDFPYRGVSVTTYSC